MPDRIGIYPGTFDPITYGHIDVINRAARLVDTLIIAIAADIPKTPIFSLEKRTAMVRQQITKLNQKQTAVRVAAFHGLLVNFAMENQATIIVRGLRAVSDFEYEFQMACMNGRLQPEIETVFLPADETVQFISSKFVREIARLGGNILPFVPEEVAQELKAYYSV